MISAINQMWRIRSRLSEITKRAKNETAPEKILIFAPEHLINPNHSEKSLCCADWWQPGTKRVFMIVLSKIGEITDIRIISVMWGIRSRLSRETTKNRKSEEKIK